MEPELLKVDFDNCDCCFLEVLLQSGLRPLHLHVEVSSFIPPPLVYRPTAFGQSIGDSMLELGMEHELRGHMMHCSLSAYAEMLQPLGYKLVRLILHDAIFAQETVVSSSEDPTLWREITDMEAAWFGSFFCHPLRSALTIEMEYTSRFLYDYRLWNSPEIAADTRLQYLQDYLDRWQKPRASYVLRIAGEQSRLSVLYDHVAILYCLVITGVVHSKLWLSRTLCEIILTLTYSDCISLFCAQQKGNNSHAISTARGLIGS